MPTEIANRDDRASGALATIHESGNLRLTQVRAGGCQISIWDWSLPDGSCRHLVWVRCRRCRRFWQFEHFPLKWAELHGQARHGDSDELERRAG